MLKRIALGALSALFGFGLLPSAVAEEAGAGIIEEVVVTATRRATNQQSTALSITTVTAEQIEKRFMTDLRGVADMAPNVVMENVTGFNAAAFSIRGQGTNDIITTIDTATGVVIDGFVLVHSQSQLLDTFDLASIEILRGPQGTLFGKNTTGGVINVKTKRPVMNEFTTQIVGRAGNDGLGEGKFAVNIPLIDDTLAARLMATYTTHDGFYKNDKISQVFGTSAQPETPLGLAVNGDGRDLGGTEVFFMRGKLLWEPTDTYSALVSVEYFQDSSDSPPAVNETPADGTDSQGIFRAFLFNPIGFPGIQQTCPNTTKSRKDCIFSTGVSFRGDGIRMEDGHRTDKFQLLIEQSLDVGNFNYNLLFGYLDQEERLPSTYTGEALPSLFDATRNVEREQFQFEGRVTSDLDGPFNFTAGAGYFINNLDWRAISYVGFTAVPFLFDGDGDGNPETPVSIFGPGTLCDIENIDAANGSSDIVPGLFVDGNGCLLINPTANDRTNFAPLKQDGKAIGIYFDGTYDLTEQLTLTAGIRYSDEEKDFFKRSGAALTPEQVEIFNNTKGDKTLEKTMSDAEFDFITDQDESWDGVSLRVGLDYQINDDLFTYFMFSEGFKSGSFVETCATTTSCDASFDQEESTQYELGIKADLLDNSLRINASVFFLDVKDVVRSQVVQIVNRFGDPDQETQFRNIAGQENYGGEVEATWYPNAELRLQATGAYLHCEYTEFTTDLDGDGINDDASGLEPNFCPEWQLSLDGNYVFVLGGGGTINLNGSIHWTPEAEYSVFNSDFTQIQERTILNANISYQDPSAHWKATVFGKNLLDEAYRVSANSVAGLWNFSQYGPRLQWGVELMFTFD